MRNLLTFHSNAFLWPVFDLSGEDNAGPHTDYIVSHVKFQGVETKHFNPEKTNFNRWVRFQKHQWDL